MKSESLLNSELNTDNKGFSIVELLVAVAILAAVFTPVLRSFTTAAITNSRAQRIQNATSVAEKVMEEVKGNSIQELSTLSNSFASGSRSFCAITGDPTVTVADPYDGDETSDYLKDGKMIGLDYAKYKANPSYAGSDKPLTGYRIKYSDITATQGQTYDAVVNITSAQYSADGAVTDASNANINALPQITKIDSTKHAVISWEVNEYDMQAMDLLADENLNDAGTDATNVGTREGIKTSARNGGSKTTFVTITDAGSGKVKITCSTKYSAGAGYKDISFLTYTGYFVENSLAEDGDPYVYIFYSTTKNAGVDGDNFATENIYITDRTVGKKHNVFLIFQNGLAKLQQDLGGGKKINLALYLKEYKGFGESDFELKNYDHINVLPSNIVSFSDSAILAKVFTNLSDYGQVDMYDSKAKDRLYTVNVSVMKHGETDVVASLSSTVNAGEEALY